jgi:hypothetical protein
LPWNKSLSNSNIDIFDIQTIPSVNAPAYDLTAKSYITQIVYEIIAPITTTFLCLVNVNPSIVLENIGHNSTIPENVAIP